MSARVSVCRGCCCGTARKHPDVDHDEHLRLLDELLDQPRQPSRVRTTDCLGYCAASNLIVVHPTPAARKRGARQMWFGFMLDREAITQLADWVLAGGPGIASVPPALALHRVRLARDRSA